MTVSPGRRLFILSTLACALAGAKCASSPAEVVLVDRTAKVLRAEGETFRVRAVVKDSQGKVLSEASVRWGSSNPQVATVDDGVVTAQGTGRATITATAGAAVASLPVRVAIPASVQIAPKRVDALPTGSSAGFQAVVRDERGRTLSDVPVRWSSSNEAVLKVNGSGKATAVEAGYAQVVASAGDLSASAEVEVVPGNFVRIGLDPMRLNLTVGQRQRIASYGLTSEGDRVNDLRVRWTSSNPAVASVDELGWVTANQAGRALVAVTLGRRRSAADVLVTEAKERP